MEEAGEVGEGEEAELTPNASEGGNFSFAGFHHCLVKESRKMAAKGLKVERLLERLHRVFTPTGKVATQ